MAQPIPPGNVEAHIEGEISGQIAVGNYNVQIGSVHGGVVNVVAPGQQPRPRPRPTPIFLRPRPFPGLLDRAAEIGTAAAALQSALPVECCGQEGMGKTALLRYLAHQPPDVALPDGILYLSARHQPLGDLLQSLFDAFYESDVPFKPTDAQMRHALQNKRALILLDDVELARDEVEALMDAAPGCAFLLASPERRLWGEGRTVVLRGLPPDDGLALVERELGRPLPLAERSAAQSLCTALDGHPLRILQAAAMVREEGRSLAEVAQQMQSAPSAEALIALVLKPLSGPERRVLMALAALNGAPLHADHLPVLTGLPNAAPALESLLQRGLVQAHSPRYTLTGTLERDLWQALDLTPWAERALAYFADWAERHRLVSDRLLEEAEAILKTLEWAAGAGRWRGVLRLGRAVEGALVLGGRWAVWAQVLQWMLHAARALGDRVVQAWALHQSGTRALCLGDDSTARTSLIQALRLRESLGDQIGAVATRHNLDILIGPPPPPSRPSQSPETPSPGGQAAPVAPLLSKEIVVLLSVLLVVLGGLAGVWGISQLFTTPTPYPTAVVVPTITPTPVLTPVLTPTPTYTPTPTPTPTYTATNTPTPAPTHTPTHTPTFTPTPTNTNTPTSTSTPWPCGERPPDWELYTVQREDTVYSLARCRGTTVDLVLCYNRLLSTQVQVGQRLYLPPDLEGPPAPVLLEPQDGAEISCCPTEQSVFVTLRWDPVNDCSGIARYDVELVWYDDNSYSYITSTLQIEGSQSQAIISAECGTSYDWRVRALDGAENGAVDGAENGAEDGAANGAQNAGAWSERRVFVVEPDTTGPPAPALLEPQDGAEIPCPTGQPVSVTLRWNPVSDPCGIARYDVELVSYDDYGYPYTSTLQVEGSQSQAVFSGECRTSYAWQTRAVDGAGNVGEWSGLWQFRILSVEETDQIPPQVPTPLEPGGPYEKAPERLDSCDQVVLHWEAVSDNPGGSGVMGYHVHLQRYEDGAWEGAPSYLIIYQTSIDVAEWLSTDIDRYRWRVWAIDRAFNDSEESEWLYFECPDRIPPPAPTFLEPGSTDPDSPHVRGCPVTLRWDSVSDLSGVVYEVALEDWYEGWQPVDSWYPVSDSELEVDYPQCIDDYRSYRWRVRAQDGAGNWSDWSEWRYYRTSGV